MSWRVLADFPSRPRDWPSLIQAHIARQVVASGGPQGYSRYFRWRVDRGKTSSGMGFVSVNSGASRVQIRATRVLRFTLQPNHPSSVRLARTWRRSDFRVQVCRGLTFKPRFAGTIYV